MSTLALWGSQFWLRARFPAGSAGRSPALSPPPSLVSFALTIAAMLLAPACGYHVGGRASLIPDTVHTISVSAFGNATVRNTLARLLPAEIARELHARTRYTIVSDPAQADAVLTGALTNFNTMGTTTDPATGRATSAQVVVTLQITLTDRHTGKVLYSHPNFESRERYEVATDPKAYFDESGTAIERVARDVAHSVVSAILEAF
jgi:outer membrane lipopolysaccharide assembly protein LptE/RlpB